MEFSLVRLGCVSRFGAVLLFLTEFYFPCPPKKPEESRRDVCNYPIMSITF